MALINLIDRGTASTRSREATGHQRGVDIVETTGAEDHCMIKWGSKAPDDLLGYIRSSSSTRATKDPKTRRPSKIQDPTADAPARAPAAQDRVTRAPWRVIIFQKIGVRDSPGGKGKSPDVPPGTPPSAPVEFHKPDPPCGILLFSHGRGGPSRGLG